jgi:hypothetical protein
VMAKDLLSSDLNLHSVHSALLGDVSWARFYKD